MLLIILTNMTPWLGRSPFGLGPRDDPCTTLCLAGSSPYYKGYYYELVECRSFTPFFFQEENDRHGSEVNRSI